MSRVGNLAPPPKGVSERRERREGKEREREMEELRGNCWVNIGGSLGRRHARRGGGSRSQGNPARAPPSHPIHPHPIPSSSHPSHPFSRPPAAVGDHEPVLPILPHPLSGWNMPGTSKRSIRPRDTASHPHLSHFSDRLAFPSAGLPISTSNLVQCPLPSSSFREAKRASTWREREWPNRRSSADSDRH